MTDQQRPQVVIIGAGFGGLFAARMLAGRAVDVTLIDRHNFHLFTPLLYQVATCGLGPSEIAYPVRGIFRREGNVRFLLGEVVDIAPPERRVAVRVNGAVRRLGYDYLIVAAGSVGHYFGLAGVARHGFLLKDLGDAVTLRNHILRQFERAAWTEDPDEGKALTTLVVVGGGPTGLETAGALYELAEHVLRREYASLPHDPRVILVEIQDHLLTAFPAHLRQAALEQLSETVI